jgi:hypothetical protein
VPATIIGSEWFTEDEAAAVLELPLEIVQNFYMRMLADPRTPVAFHKGAGIPMLSGFTITALKGRAQRPSKHRHAR